MSSSSSASVRSSENINPTSSSSANVEPKDEVEALRDIVRVGYGPALRVMRGLYTVPPP
jgi:hypothetical protein